MAMIEVTYEMTMDVTTSWDAVKRIPKYEDITGELIFEHLCDLTPEARGLFGFSADEDMRANPSFLIHARNMVDMIDCAVGFLGPDLDPLTEDLIELGERHFSYGVKPEYLPLMKASLFHVLEKVLKNKFTREKKLAWSRVFDFMSSKMAIGMST